MSRIKLSKGKKDKKRQEWPAVVYLCMMGLGVLGYLFARIGLGAYSHPVHWAFGLIGALLGIPIGWVWYRWRGDVF